MCPAFRPPLYLGEQLHRCSEHTLLLALPLQRVCHGRCHCLTNRRHAASCCAAIRASQSQLHRWIWPAAAHWASVCCTGEVQNCWHTTLFPIYYELKSLFPLSFQHLFLTFPRIVFMLGFVVFIFFLLAGYALFHSYLALVNQTSNEWYKSRGYLCQLCHPSATVDHLCSPVPDHSKRHYYSRGLLRNLGEIFFPPQSVKKKDNWKEDTAFSVMLRLLYVPLDLLSLRTAAEWRNKVYVSDFFLGSGVCLSQVSWFGHKHNSCQIMVC